MNGIKMMIFTEIYWRYSVNIAFSKVICSCSRLCVKPPFLLTDIVAFPQKSPEDETIMCTICYTYRSHNQIPIITCDNDKCNLIYHASCLKWWFSTVRDNKTFLTVTSGFCHCKAVILALDVIGWNLYNLINFVLISRNCQHHLHSYSSNEIVTFL